MRAALFHGPVMSFVAPAPCGPGPCAFTARVRRWHGLFGTGNLRSDPGRRLLCEPLSTAAPASPPVALVAEQPILLIVRKEFPADNLVDFIAYAKANQQKMQFGSAGTGSGVHLACVLFNAAIGVDIVHVPYRGTAP